MVTIRELASTSNAADDDDNLSLPSINDDDETDDSDRELQIAFQKGLLKPGLNVVQQVVQKKWINNTSAMKSKLAELDKNLDWIERMDVTVDRPKDKKATVADEDDFKREVSFIKQAQKSVLIGLEKLHKMGVVTKRPEDYYAEMFKSDDHMKKVRQKLLDMQQTKQKSEAAKKIRDERKFAVRIQKEVAVERQKEKRQLSDAVKKHKKGVKDQFDKIIGDGNPTGNRLSKKRALKDEKFGHGGRKKRSKWNTAESSNDFTNFGSRSNRAGAKTMKNKKKGGSKKKQRPGKQRRQKQRSGGGKR